MNTNDISGSPKELRGWVPGNESHLRAEEWADPFS